MSVTDRQDRQGKDEHRHAGGNQLDISHGLHADDQVPRERDDGDWVQSLQPLQGVQAKAPQQAFPRLESAAAGMEN